MARLRYFFKRLMRIDFSRFLCVFKRLKDESGKSSAWLIADLLACGIKYNAGYMDYAIARMYNLNNNQRKTVITRGISNSIVHAMNDKAFWHTFDDKAQFNERFKPFVSRPWIKLTRDSKPDEFIAFLDGLNAIFIKPLEGSSGVGIDKHIVSDISDPIALFERLLANGPYIVEECIVQHAKLSALSPNSINTIRIATLIGDLDQGAVYAFLRIGAGGFVDNVDQGGMAARIDLNSGILQTPAADKNGNVYELHPTTGLPIRGFEVPYFKEALSMCLAAMHEVPQLRYVAWDVAITPKGPQFVEGNSFPSHAVPQFAAHYEDGIGILPAFSKFIDLKSLA